MNFVINFYFKDNVIEIQQIGIESKYIYKIKSGCQVVYFYFLFIYFYLSYFCKNFKENIIEK